jgi:cystathionine beta-synthase
VERTATATSCSSAEEAIGGTPLVRLNRITAGARALTLAKLEFLNPGGSIKDRMAVAMIEHAERAGLLAPGGTIVEPTSGNTGAALAMVAAIRGYRCILTVPEKTSHEKIAVLRAYGAEVIVAPPVPADSPESYTAIAAQIARDLPGAYSPNQYANPINPLAHEQLTGVEIWEQTGGAITHLIAGIGTGGTICGIARALKARNPNVRIVGVDAIGSIYSGGMPAPYAIEGIGRSYLPATLDLSVIDRIERVGDRDAFLMARRAAREEGLLAGGSSGAALVATERLARELDSDAVVVTILPDSGRGYLSKIFNDEWMAARDFLGPRGTPLGEVLARVGGDDRFVRSTITVREAARILAERNIDDAAVVDDECLVGRISVQAVLDCLERAPHKLDATIGEVLLPPFPLLDRSACLDDALRAIRGGHRQVVVSDGGRPIAALRAQDLIAFTLDE